MTGKFRKRILPWITAGVMSLEALVNFGCKGNPVGPDSAPYFTSSTPTAETTQTKIGNSHTVRGNAEDPDGDSFQYKTLKDGTQVNNTNEYTFTIDKKGMTKIQVVAYNALSDTLTKYFSANNQAPTANDKSVTMDEESTKKIPQTDLGTDPDGDELEYNVTSTSNGVNAKFENNNLEITGIQDYFGNASVNYSVSDGEANSNGTVSVIVNNVDDPPTATNVQLTPLEAFIGDTLWVNYDYNDVENDLEGDTPINQYVNNQLANSGEMVLTNDLQAGDIVKASITPTDDKGVTGTEVFTNEVTLKANPKVLINGRILDTDTQEINASLLAWIVMNGDTTWTNTGEYTAEIAPTSNLEVKAGYRTQNKENPKSYVTTIRGIDASTDVAGLDIAIVTYNNMNTTPEEFRIMMDEANFSWTGSSQPQIDEGAKGLEEGMYWSLAKKSNKFNTEYTNQEWTDLQATINIINNYLIKPLPIVLDYSGEYPETEEETRGKIFVRKRLDAGRGSIVSFEYDNDGKIDFVSINIRDPSNYPGATREEGASALASPAPIGDSRLAGGKTIFYEYEAIDIITDADIKAIKMIENITYEVGNLWPKMPIDDILNIQ